MLTDLYLLPLSEEQDVNQVLVQQQCSQGIANAYETTTIVWLAFTFCLMELSGSLEEQTAKGREERGRTLSTEDNFALH